MSTPHVLVLPFPTPGHVNPLMHFSKKLAEHGFKVTFVNTDSNHKKVVRAINEQDNLAGFAVKLTSIPDFSGPDVDIDSPSTLSGILSTMPSELEKVIHDINDRDNGSNRITGIIADLNMAWALEVAQEQGIKGAVLCPSSAAIFALEQYMPKLIEDGIMDSDGFPKVKGKFQLSPCMPTMDTADIPWCRMGDSTSSPKAMFDYHAKMIRTSHLTDWWLFNTTTELEPGALSLFPKILPIGPLIESSKTRSPGQFWEEDFSCLSWLDQQPPCSVIYVAFGSSTILDPDQLMELALGLDLTNRSFLWVVRQDANSNTKNAFPDDFVGTRGKIVKWAPQQKVLSHPATACFISHCGWNSTIEGVSNGVPILCWPYFVDQFFDKTYICDVWKVGLGFDLNEKGLATRGEIKKKVDHLLADEDIRGRSEKLKKLIVNNIAEGGQSSENLKKFMEWLIE